MILALLLLALAQSPRPEYVSLLATLAVPERMDGKTIVTIGYLEFRESGAMLFLAEEDARFQIQDNAIKVEVSGEHLRVAKKINRKYVLVEGVFHASPPKADSGPAGVVTDVTRLIFWTWQG